MVGAQSLQEMVGALRPSAALELVWLLSNMVVAIKSGHSLKETQVTC